MKKLLIIFALLQICFLAKAQEVTIDISNFLTQDVGDYSFPDKKYTASIKESFDVITSNTIRTVTLNISNTESPIKFTGDIEKQENFELIINCASGVKISDKTDVVAVGTDQNINLIRSYIIFDDDLAMLENLSNLTFFYIKNNPSNVISGGNFVGSFEIWNTGTVTAGNFDCNFVNTSTGVVEGGNFSSWFFRNDAGGVIKNANLDGGSEIDNAGTIENINVENYYSITNSGTINNISCYSNKTTQDYYSSVRIINTQNGVIKGGKFLYNECLSEVTLDNYGVISGGKFGNNTSNDNNLIVKHQEDAVITHDNFNYKRFENYSTLKGFTFGTSPQDGVFVNYNQVENCSFQKSFEQEMYSYYNESVAKNCKFVSVDGKENSNVVKSGRLIDCTSDARSHLEVINNSTIVSGIYKGKVILGDWNSNDYACSYSPYYNPTILQGTFSNELKVAYDGIIENGTFEGPVYNLGKIVNGTFEKSVYCTGFKDENKATFECKIANNVIENGNFKLDVSANIIKDGYFAGVTQYYDRIENGIFAMFPEKYDAKEVSSIDINHPETFLKGIIINAGVDSTRNFEQFNYQLPSVEVIEGTITKVDGKELQTPSTKIFYKGDYNFTILANEPKATFRKWAVLGDKPNINLEENQVEYQSKNIKYVVFNANAKDADCVVTFGDGKDKDFPNQKIEFGQKLTKPEKVPFLDDDHHFLGWYLGDKLFDFDSPVTSDITLVAKFHEHTFVNYVSNEDAICGQDGTKTATCEFETCDAKHTIDDPGSALEQIFTKVWDDVVAVINPNKEYVKFQWYHNDNLVSENDFYCQNGGLEGKYYLIAFKADGTKQKSCELEFQKNPISKNLKIYPNPAKDYVEIINHKANIGDKITVLSSFGEKQFTSYVDNQEKIILDVTSLKSGLYIIKINNSTYKFTIE